eukprot:scaffold4973_cov135-Cylindrotheca_fusiformis.AAC.3
MSTFDLFLRGCAVTMLFITILRQKQCILYSSTSTSFGSTTELKSTSVIGTDGSIIPTRQSSFSSLPNSCLKNEIQTRFPTFPDESSDIAWTKRADGSQEVSLPGTCALHRFSGTEAQRCLANQHIVMAGDSLSRYQFLDLVYLIEHGEYSPNFGRPEEGEDCKHYDEFGNSTCSDMNGFLWYKEYGSWDEYHIDIGGREGGMGPFNGRLECQCAVQMNKLTLLLRYVSKDGIMLTFLKEAGWGTTPEVIRGWKASGCAEDGTCSYTPSKADELRNTPTRDINEVIEDGMDTNGTIRKYIPPPDHVIYNRGLWGGFPLNRARKLFARMKGWARETCYYKSTTAGSGAIHRPIFSSKEAQIRQAAEEAGCRNYHLHHLTGQFAHLDHEKDGRDDIFVDEIHYQPWVYHELNNVLLNMLCMDGTY